MNADPHPSVCYSSRNDQSQTTGSRLTVSWPRAHDSASSSQKCDFSNKPADPDAADPFYHSFNSEKQELLDLKLQIVKQKAKFDKLSSLFLKTERARAEASSNMDIESMQILVHTNQKIVADNARLKATLQDYIMSSDNDEQVIKTLQRENELLRQHQLKVKVKVKKTPSSSSALETTITAPGIHHSGDDCSTLPTLDDSSQSCRNREYINMLVNNNVSTSDLILLTNDNNNNMEPTSSTSTNSNRYSRFRSNSEPTKTTSSSNKVLPPPSHDAPSRMSSKARESRFDIRRLCSSLTDRSPHHRTTISKQSDDLLVDFRKGPRSRDAASSLRWSFKS